MAKKKNIKEMSLNDLKSTLSDYKDAMFNLRFQKSLQQLEYPQQLRHMRRDIARVKTLIKQLEDKNRNKA